MTKITNELESIKKTQEEILNKMDTLVRTIFNMFQAIQGIQVSHSGLKQFSTYIFDQGIIHNWLDEPPIEGDIDEENEEE